MTSEPHNDSTPGQPPAASPLGPPIPLWKINDRIKGIVEAQTGGHRLQWGPGPLAAPTARSLATTASPTATMSSSSPISSSSRWTTSLRQSILQRAFQGHLVRQDPNDEAAAIILACIKVEKAQRAGKGQAGKVRKKPTPCQLELL